MNKINEIYDKHYKDWGCLKNLYVQPDTDEVVDEIIEEKRYIKDRAKTYMSLKKGYKG